MKMTISNNNQNVGLNLLNNRYTSVGVCLVPTLCLQIVNQKVKK